MTPELWNFNQDREFARKRDERRNSATWFKPRNQVAGSWPGASVLHDPPSGKMIVDSPVAC
jgi:hypothetical protein